MNTVGELAERIEAAITDLVTAQTELRDASQEAARAERAYRLDRSVKFAQSRGETVAAREYDVDRLAADTRYDAKLAEDLRQASLENVRSRRAILTAYQTLANALKEELSFARSDPS